MTNRAAATKLSDWLASRGVSKDDITTLVELSEHPGLFETPERIMSPDLWFYYPGNSRFVLLGSCPNGDGIALDTAERPGAVFYIDHERVHDAISDCERVVCVAGSLSNYLHCCMEESDFPYDFWEAKRRL